MKKLTQQLIIITAISLLFLGSFSTIAKADFDLLGKNEGPLAEATTQRLHYSDDSTPILHQIKTLRLQRTILIGAWVSLLLIGGIYIHHIKSNHLTEKQFIQIKQELAGKKNKDILELKNKELATASLKLIEKETLIETLREKLSNGSENIKIQELRHILGSSSKSSSQRWKEFEARFASVNDLFYANLTHQFPHLTQGDLKLCALLKLNFSSKEMAKLLGISVESVHTTRSRLRKKLSLSRNMNLTEFIANV